MGAIGVKLVIQIPCFNEEEALPQTVADLPRAVEGIDEIEVLIIDDGSSDRTLEVAREAGVHHVVRFTRHKGLARAFMAGLDAALRAGADIIVNTDADNQYCGADIPKLVQPILEHRADMVVGERPINDIEHFGFTKKRLQRIGSWLIRRVSKTTIPDATSGFRAYSRDAALRMNVLNDFTYTLETIIQAGQSDIAITHVPIRTNPPTRESRLFRSTPQYLKRSILTIIRIFTVYKPLRVFAGVGGMIFGLGFLLGVRFLYFFLFARQASTGKIQSVVLAAVLMIIGFQVVVLGLIADLIAANRKLLQDTLFRVRRLELEEQEHLRREPAERPGPSPSDAP